MCTLRAAKAGLHCACAETDWRAPALTPPCRPASASARAHQTAAGTDRQPSKTSSIDAKEAAKFAALANEWWQPRGPFLPLHRMNAARCKFIRDAVCAMQGLDPQSKEPFQGLTALDVGCGGGILSESIARLGAHTHGIDITEPNVMAATAHAVSDPLISSRVRYACTVCIRNCESACTRAQLASRASAPCAKSSACPALLGHGLISLMLLLSASRCASGTSVCR